MNAIDIVRQMVANGQVSQEVAEKYFPELKGRDGGKIRERLIAFLSQCKSVYGDSFKQFDLNIDEALAWLEKQGEQQSTENKGMNIDEENMTPFQKKVFCIIDSTVEEEQGLKQVCDELLALASNEIEQEPACSEEDERNINEILYLIEANYLSSEEPHDRLINFLKSFKDRYTWKPSEEPVSEKNLSNVQRIGKNWKEEQFEKNRVKHCNSITKEQAELEQGFIDQHLDKHRRMPTYLDAIEYGMMLQKEQMMARAVDGEVGYWNLRGLSVNVEFPRSVNEGDKVKVIVIK